MEPIQVNVTIKLDDTVQAFLTKLFSGTSAVAPTQAKPAVPAKPATAPAAPAKPVVAPAATQGSTITIDALRELAMTKMNAHRAEIKQKLTDLNTPSITKLDPAKYQDMYDFLNSLA